MIRREELLGAILPTSLILFLAGVAVAISLPVLGHPDRVFMFNDGAIETTLAEGSRLPGRLLRHWDEQFFIGMGRRASGLNTANLLEWSLGPHQYRRWGLLVAVVFAGWAAYVGCRLSGRSRAASFVAGTVAGLCGWTITFPMAGLASRTWLLAWMFLSVGLISYGKRHGGWLSYLLAGGFLGMAIADSPDIGVLAALCCALYFILLHFGSKAAFRGTTAVPSLAKLAAYVAVCALIASQTVLHMFELYVRPPEAATSDATSSAAKPAYQWATQWSLPANETWSLIVSDYHGASSRSESHPYWGAMGRSGGFEEHGRGFANFKLSGYSLGTVPLTLILFGWLYAGRASADERAVFFILNGMALLCLVLGWGKYHVLYRLFYELPMMSSIRNPEKWLCGVVVFIVLAAALAFDLLVRRVGGPDDRRPAERWMICAAAAALPALLLLNLAALSSKPAFVGRLRAVGFGAIAETAYTNSLHSLLVALACATASGAAIAVVLFVKRTHLDPAVAAVLVLTSVVELVPAARPYVIPYRYLHMLEQNALMTLLEARAPDNRIKVVPPGDALLNHFRLTWLRARGFKLFDPVSVRNLPGDYSAVFRRFESDPLTLWKLGAVRYFICTPQATTQLVSAAPGRFAKVAEFTFTPTLEGGMRPVLVSELPAGAPHFLLLELRDALPYVRFSTSVEAVANREEALLALGAAQPGGVWVDYIEAPDLDVPAVDVRVPGSVEVLSESPIKLRLRTESTAGGMLIVAEKYDPHWTAEVAGRASRVYRANGILQSLRIPAGRHEVTLTYRPPRAPLYLAVAGWGVQSMLLVLFVVSASRARRRTHDGSFQGGGGGEGPQARASTPNASSS